jgi:hypothetical protein
MRGESATQDTKPVFLVLRRLAFFRFGKSLRSRLVNFTLISILKKCCIQRTDRIARLKSQNSLKISNGVVKIACSERTYVS